MTLQDIFDQLAYGELRQMAVGEWDSEGKGVPADKRKQVWLNVKLGLTELHKRFLLRERTLTLEVQPGLLTYTIDPRFAVSNTRSREALKYIDDSAEAFQGEIFKIERVYVDGDELPLNALDDADSLHTPGFNRLLLPADFAEESLQVVCRCDHEPVKEFLVPDSPELIQLQLPGTHLWALLLFAASRMHLPSDRAGGGEGNNFLLKFEAECARLSEQNTVIQQTHEPTRFERRGFV